MFANVHSRSSPARNTLEKGGVALSPRVFLFVAVVLLTFFCVVAESCTNAQYVKIQLSVSGTNLQLSEVEIWAGATNVATSGSASQVTTTAGYPAANCNDGSHDQAVGTQCRTTSVANAWWEINLGGVECIDTVVVYGREDAALTYTQLDKLADATLTVEDTSRTVLHSFTMAGESVNLFHVNYDPTPKGQFIRVEAGKSDNIAMREVMVIDNTGSNIATSGTASQGPSTVTTLVASYCNDGSRAVSASEVCTTSAHNDAYWELDLGSEVTSLSHIAIFNRMDAQVIAINRATLFSLDANRKPLHAWTVNDNMAQTHYFPTVTLPTCGFHTLKVESGSNNVVEMTEVEVWYNNENVALTKTPSQSSNSTADYTASKCIDRVWLHNYDDKRPSSCKTSAGYNEWFQIPFGGSQCIDFLRLGFHENKVDYTTSPTHGASLLLLSSTGIPMRVFNLEGYQRHQYLVNASYRDPTLAGCITSRYVRIQRTTAQRLGLQEVQVYEGKIDLALWKTTVTMSTTDGSNVAFNAVDGDWTDSRKALTLSSDTEWWEIDLTTDYCVDHVSIRGDNTVGRMAGVQVLLLDSSRNTLKIWDTQTDTTLIQTFWASAIPRGTRFINVHTQQNTWPGAKEIYAMSNGVNVAAGKETYWRSVYAGGTMTAIVDGVYDATGCATDQGLNQWFQIDLGQEYELDSITYMRNAEHKLRMQYGTVVTMDENQKIVNASQVSSSPMETYHFEPAKPICNIRYIYVNTYNNRQVSMQELLAWYNGTNVAKGKSATFHSEAASGGTADKCVDGTPAFSHVHETESICRVSSSWDAWWEVDLGTPTCLDYIHIFTSEQYPDEMNNNPVVLYDANHLPLRTFTHLTPDQGQHYLWVNESYAPNIPTEANCKMARYFRADRTNANYLVLYEVQIFQGHINVALQKTATGGPVHLSYTPDLAVDGRLNTFSHTTASTAAYWEVDLGQEYCVSHVAVSKQAHHITRYASVTFHLMDSSRTDVETWTPYQDRAVGVYYVTNYNPPLLAKTVMIDCAKAVWLWMRELEVWRGTTNLAAGRWTLQARTYLGHSSDRMVDGDTTHTEFAQSGAADENFRWFLELDEEYIDAERIFYYNHLQDASRAEFSAVVVFDKYVRPLQSFPIKAAVAESFYLDPNAVIPHCGIRYVRIHAKSAHQFQEVFVFRNGENLAVNGTAFQTADLNGNTPASVCNDRTIDFISPYKICASPSVAANDHYWELDLGSEVCIDFVHIEHRHYAPADLNMASLMFSDASRIPIRSFHITPDVFGSNYVLNASYHPTNPGCVEARYLKLQRGLLTLEEITAYSGPLNVALGKSITLSTNGATGPRCVDGSVAPDGAYYCTTNSATDEWIEVDFGQSYCIDRVVLYALGGYLDRMDQVNTTLWNSDKTAVVQQWTLQAELVQVLNPTGATLVNTSRYLRVEQNTNTFNQVRELEAWGFGSPPTNVASGCTAYEYSIGQPASNVVNGIKDVDASGAWTGGTGRAYIEVDFGAEKELDTIGVWNRWTSPTRMDGNALVMKDINHVPVRVFPLTSHLTHLFNVQDPVNCGVRYIRIENGNGFHLEFNEITVASNGQDISKGRPASYSGGTYDSASYPPSHAVDGVPYWGTYTRFLSQPTSASVIIYLEIDLGAPKCIDFVIVHNRWNTPTHSTNAGILLYDTDYKPLRGSRTGANYYTEWHVFNTTVRQRPGCVDAQILRIERTTTGYLSFNEIAAYVADVNVAQGGTQTMSSVGSGGNCVDGNTRADSYCQTGSNVDQWIQVDFGATHCIDSVVTWSRLTQHLNAVGSVIKLLDSTGTVTKKQWTADEYRKVNVLDVDGVPNNNSIRYVLLQAASASGLPVREVKVIRQGVNLAANGTAYQSEDSGSFVASLCNNDDTRYWISGVQQHCLTSSNQDSWWMLDLGANYDDIDYVVLWHWITVVDRLQDTAVVLLNELHKPVRSKTITGVSAVETLHFNDTAAAVNCGIRYIRVEVGNGAIVLSLHEVEVWRNQQNLAFNKPATISTQNGVHEGKYAVDGYTHFNATATGTLAQSTVSYDSYLEIDLEAEYCLDYVRVVSNRVNVGALDKAALVSLNANREPVQTKELKAVAAQHIFFNESYREPLTPGCKSGRYVRLENPAEYIVIAELEVYEGDMNVALGKSTSSEAVAGGGFADAYGVDGDTIGTSIRYAHSTLSTTAWYEVDLGQEYCISHIVWYGQYGWQQRKVGVAVSLLNASRATVQSWTAASEQVLYGDSYKQVEMFHISPPRNDTRYVHALQSKSDYLVMRELEVWATGTNVALGKRTYMSSSLDGTNRGGDRCVDGDRDDSNVSPFQQTCCTGTGEGVWMEVDLETEHTVDRVAASCQKDGTGVEVPRMANTEVVLYNNRRTPIRSFRGRQQPSIVHHVADSERKHCGVRFLNISVNQNRVLSLAEVSVYGADGVNYALSAQGASITQSATPDASYGASNCNDGFPYYSYHYCATDSDHNAYLEIDFGQDRCIEFIEVLNREDFRADWPLYHDMFLSTASREPLQHFSLRGSTRTRYQVNPALAKPQGLEGCLPDVQKIHIQRKTAEHVVLYQLEVVVNGTNVALGSQGSTQSTNHGNSATLDVGSTDGSRLTAAPYGEATNLGASEWVQLDLGESYCVDIVNLCFDHDLLSTRFPGLIISMRAANDTVLKSYDTDTIASDHQFVTLHLNPNTARANKIRFVEVFGTSLNALRLREVQVEQNGTNLATGSTTTFLYDSGTTSSSCVDGSTASSSVCASTVSASNARWFLDLGSEKNFETITVFNDFTAPSALAGAMLVVRNQFGVALRSWLLDSSVVRTLSAATAADTIESIPNPAPAVPRYCGVRYVRVEPSGNTALTLQQVYVHALGTRENLALAGSATQSSTATETGGESFGPSVCNSGDNTTLSSPAKACLTNPSLDAYWEVDFGEEKCIEQITIYNRGGGSHMTSGQVRVKSDLGTTFKTFYLNGDQVQIYHVDPEYIMDSARYVAVMLQSGTIHMAEVEVFRGERNIASVGAERHLWQTTTKSPTNADGSGPEICVDGVTVSEASNAVCQTQAGDNQAWVLDVGSETCINRIVVYNKADAGAALDRASLLLFDTQWYLDEVYPLTSATTQTFDTTAQGMCTPTMSFSLTPTVTLTPTTSLSRSESISETATVTVTPPPTGTPTATMTQTTSETLSLTWTQSQSSSGTLSVTHTKSETGGTRSLSLTVTPPETVSATVSVSSSGSQSLTNTETITPPPTPTATFSSTQTASSTLSPTRTLTPSDTLTPTDTTTLSHTATLTPSDSLTPSSSLTLTRSESLSPTISLTQTATTSLSHTPSVTPTGSLTASETLSFSPTISVTKTTSISQSETISFSETRTLPLTATEPITETWTLEQTASKSLSTTASLPFYCGGLVPTECRRQQPVCNLTESNSCYFSGCSYIPGEENCIRHGCHWKPAEETNANYTGNCTKPPECRDISEAGDCDLLSHCRWMDNYCKPDLTPCHTFEASYACSAAECAWNSLVSPNCFRVIRNPALCRLVRDKGTCKAQNCLWVSALQRCDRWDLECSDMIPRPDTCTEIDRCVYFQQKKTCVSLDNLGDDAVVAVRHPSTVFPAQNFDLALYGVPLEAQNDIAFIDVGEKDPDTCPQGNSLLDEPFIVHSDAYDRSQYASMVYDVVLFNKGNYTICVRLNATHSAGPFSKVTVDTPTPQLTSCASTPNPAYQSENFMIFIQGLGLDPLGRFSVVPNTTDECPMYNESNYRQITAWEQAGTTAQYRVRHNGGYRLCYVNRGLFPVMCPNDIVVSGLPPWFDAIVLNEIDQGLPKVDGESVTQTNALFCKGMPGLELNKTKGIFAHPASYDIMFGDGVASYPGGSLCVFPIAPLSMPAITGEVGALLLSVNYVAMEATDMALVFAPNGNLYLRYCASFNLPETCRASICHWNELMSQCQLPEVDIPSTCPTRLAGYTLLRTLTYDVMLEAEEDKKPLPLPINGGGIVVICSVQSGAPKVGIGASLSYKTQETYCPNDCQDDRGTSHGVCVADERGQQSCRCHFGWRGADCSEPAECAGTGFRANTVRAAKGSASVEMKISEPCASVYKADPRRNAPTTPGFRRMQKFSIGLSISDLRLTDTAKERSIGVTCNNSYVEIRQKNHLGRLLKRLCPSDTAEGEVYRVLLPSDVSAYVEHSGGRTGDSMVVDYTAVSKVCPGNSLTTGIPESDEEKCDGKGECVLKDYDAPETITDSMYECACKLPWASSYIGSSCDTCGFGYVASKFPTCPSALACARGCAGHGTCLGSHCQCEPGYFGLDCTLFDDKERMDKLEPYLEVRIPLNGADAGNCIQEGDVDRTLLDCSMKGATIPCRVEDRPKGRNFAKQENSIFDSATTSFFFDDDDDTRRRRQTDSDTPSGVTTSASSTSGANATVDSSAVKGNSSRVDEGMSFNLLATQNTYPQFVRSDNVTATVGGTMTIVGWVKVTAMTRGFLFAKTDSAFFSDGRSPVLEKAMVDIQSRDVPLHKMRLLGEAVNLHMGVFFNGPKKRVDLIVSNPAMKNKTGEKEEWLYVRHFRLGDKTAGTLFDGSWRHFAMKIYKQENREEAQVFIDGYTQMAHVDFVQCLPWLPPMFDGRETNISMTSPGVVVQYPGVSVWWGYRLRGSLDELHIYSKPLSQRSIIRVGGPEFLSSLFISETALYSLIAVCFVCLIAMFVIYKRHWFEKPPASDERPVTPEPEEEEGEKGGGEEEERGKDEKNNGDDEREKTPEPEGKDRDKDLAVSQKEDSPQEINRKRSKISEHFLRIQAQGRATATGTATTAAANTTDEESQPATFHPLAPPRTKDRTTASRSADPEDVFEEEGIDFVDMADPSPPQTQSSSQHSPVYIGDDWGDISFKSEDIEDALAGGEEGGEDVIELGLKSVRAQLEYRREQYLKQTLELNQSAAVDSGSGAAIHSPDDDIALQFSGALAQSVKETADQDRQIERSLKLVGHMHRKQLEVAKLESEKAAAERQRPFILLDELMEITKREEEASMKAKLKSKKTVVKNSSTAFQAAIASIAMFCSTTGGATGRSRIPLVLRPFVDVLQILGQVSGALNFPLEWKEVFGAFTIAFTFDFLQAFGLPFGPVFYLIGIISLICFVILTGIQLTSKDAGGEKKEVLRFMEKRLEERKKCEEEGIPFKEKGQKKELVILIVATLLSVLYIPVTQQAIQAIFCHRSIMCQYDCYVDQEHKNLVAMGIVTGILVTIGTPILFTVVIRRVSIKYQYYIGTFDQDLQVLHWPKFHKIYRTPFNTIYEKYTYSQAYFEVVMMLFKVMMCFFAMSMVPETLAQLVSIVILQCFFMLVVVNTKPFFDPIGNRILLAVHSFMVSTLCLQCFSLLFPESKAVGIVMIVLTFGLIVFVIVAIRMALKPMFKKPDVDDEEEEEKDEEKEEEEEGKQQEGEEEASSVEFAGVIPKPGSGSPTRAVPIPDEIEEIPLEEQPREEQEDGEAEEKVEETTREYLDLNAAPSQNGGKEKGADSPASLVPEEGSSPRPSSEGVLVVAAAKEDDDCCCSDVENA